jgi:prepilin-type processing-associated H-X9-DG protein
LSEIQSPATVVLAFDYRLNNSPRVMGYGAGSSVAYLQNPANAAYYAPLVRHLEGGNYLMCDGHVKWYKPTQVSSDGNVAGKAVWFNPASAG